MKNIIILYIMENVYNFFKFNRFVNIIGIILNNCVEVNLFWIDIVGLVIFYFIFMYEIGLFWNKWNDGIVIIIVVFVDVDILFI